MFELYFLLLFHIFYDLIYWKSWWNGVYDVEIWHERMLHEMQENEDTWQVIYEICDICYVNS